MVDSQPTRRRVLTLSGTLLAGLAGCIGDNETTESEPNGTSMPTEAPNDTATGGPDDTATGTGDSPDEPSATPTEPRDVLFQSTGGTERTGTLYGNGDCAVLLVPQINLDRGSWEAQATALAETGVLAFAIDEGEDEKVAGVAGAIRYLREEKEVETLVVVGASSGGEAAVIAAADRPAAVDGVVTLSAAGGADRAGELQARSLFVVSKGDDQRFVDTAKRLHENAPDPTELVTYDGSAHGQRLFSSDHADDLSTRLESFVSALC